MVTTDPIADLLTRIRNGNRNKTAAVDVPASRMKRAVLDVLVREGYLREWREVPAKPSAFLRVYLKYGPRGERVIQRIDRVSRPGRRIYRGKEDLPRPLSGLGIVIVSTSRGVLSDRECRTRRVGGEVLARVW